MPFGLGFFATAGAGAGGGSFDLLETTLITTNTASVTFSNLNNYSAYKHLQLRMTTRTSRTDFSLSVNDLRFNADTGANYSRHSLEGNGSSVASGYPGGATNEIALISSVTNEQTANIFSGLVVDILDYSNTSKYTTIRALGGQASSNSRVMLVSGVWMNTAAVTSITLLPSSSYSYISGTRISLYGIK